MDPIKIKIQNQLKELIAQGKIEEPIQLLLDKVKHDDVLLIASRLRRIERQNNKGLTTLEVYNVEINKITNSVIRIIDEGSIISKNKSKRKLKLMLYYVFIVSFLDFNKIKTVLLYLTGGITVIVSSVFVYDKIMVNQKLNKTSLEISFISCFDDFDLGSVSFAIGNLEEKKAANLETYHIQVPNNFRFTGLNYFYPKAYFTLVDSVNQSSFVYIDLQEYVTSDRNNYLYVLNNKENCKTIIQEESNTDDDQIIKVDSLNSFGDSLSIVFRIITY